MLKKILLAVCFLCSLHSHDQASMQAAFAGAMGKFIADRGFPGAVVCIYQNNQMILNEAYGKNVDVNEIYPLASISKYFTEKAIEKLIEEKLLSRSDKAWNYLHLTVSPQDPLVQEITIGQLLDHRGGWDSEVSDDPLFDETVTRTNPKDLIEKVMCSKMLDYVPGVQNVYSNFGYLVLGLIIENITGMSYLEYVNQTFAKPLNLQLTQAETPSTFARETPFATQYSLELSTPSFGLAARAQDIAQIISSRAKSRVENFWLSGSLPGTITSLVRRRVNHVTIVVFIPDRDDNCWKDDILDLRKEIDRAAGSLGL
ncbi:MAG TPA: serine hydrolase domain-containing protein [Rhabdochlamydiaceae bacterium]|jgi:CubicO group peptidase (beta-lactamase class C family)|nr:serine hydrolase domain-containing protein [Rhabdochlamydiaceae bacterium]